MKRAFSLLEIIFALAIIGLIVSYVLKSGSSIFGEATLTKAKAEIALIRHSLNINKNKRIRLGLGAYPQTLDSAKTNTSNELLFAGVGEQKLLTHPLVSTSTSQKEVGKFAKLSDNSYTLYLSKDTFLEFEYNSNNGTFTCKSQDNLCKEVE